MKSGFLKQSELFVFVALLLALALVWVQSQPGPEDMNKKVAEAERKAAQAERRATDAEREAARNRDEAEKATRQRDETAAKAESKLTDQPPVVRLSEDDPSFRFDPLSARLPDAFITALMRTNGIVDQLDHDSHQYECDVLEVIGHTDEQHIDPIGKLRDARPRRSLGQLFQNVEHILQFDRLLIAHFQSGQSEKLEPPSNTDLGMLRALSVVRILQEVKTTDPAERLKSIRCFLPYSAGQMINLSYQISTSDSGQPDNTRRRIEIRLLRSPALK